MMFVGLPAWILVVAAPQIDIMKKKIPRRKKKEGGIIVVMYGRDQLHRRKSIHAQGTTVITNARQPTLSITIATMKHLDV